MFRGDTGSSERSGPRTPRMNSNGSISNNNNNNRFRVTDSAFDNDRYFNDTSSRSTAANRHTSNQNAPSENDVIAINPDMYKYQDLVHASALTRLEAELRDLIRSRPLSTWPEYDGIGGGYQAASGKYPLPMASDNGSASDPNDNDGHHGGAVRRLSADQLDPKKAYFSERSVKESAERIYSRSSVQRYILQRLAAELNAEKEVRRDFHSYEAFKVALASPESTKLDLIKPNVVERPQPLASPVNGMSANASSAATEKEKREQQQQQRGGTSTPLLATVSTSAPPRNANSQQIQSEDNGNGKGSSGRKENSQQQHGAQGQSNYLLTNTYSYSMDDAEDGVSSSSPAVYKPGSYSHQRAVERMKLEQTIAARRQQQQQRDERNRGEREGERYSGGGSGGFFSPDSSHYSSSSCFPNGVRAGGNGGSAYSSLFPYREPRPRTFLGTHAYPNVDTDTVYLYNR